MAWNFYDSNGNLLQLSTLASVDSDQYVDGSIDVAHMSANSVDSAQYVDASIDNAHIADDAIDSEHYADGSIDTVHIADDQVTLAKMAGIARGKIIYGDASGDPAVLAVGSANQVLTHDGTDVSWVAAGGISNTQEWYADASIDVGTSTETLLSGWSEQSATRYGEIGTAMAESSGIWTFPTTGLWRIDFMSDFYASSSSRYVQGTIWVTTNNADYATTGIQAQSFYNGGASLVGYCQMNVSMLLDVSSTTNVKIKLYGYVQDVGGNFRGGATGGTIMFTRIGDAD